MQAITDTKHLKSSNSASYSCLDEGEDVGQFEWLKKDILNEWSFNLNYSYFDMRSLLILWSQLDLLSLPFCEWKNRDLDHLLDLTTAKKRNLTDESLKQFENYLENPSESTRLVILKEERSR